MPQKMFNVKTFVQPEALGRDHIDTGQHISIRPLREPHMVECIFNWNESRKLGKRLWKETCGPSVRGQMLRCKSPANSLDELCRCKWVVSLRLCGSRSGVGRFASRGEKKLEGDSRGARCQSLDHWEPLQTQQQATRGKDAHYFCFNCAEGEQGFDMRVASRTVCQC